MPLSVPVYFLGRTYVLHTRINGHQFKRSLKTADPNIAKLRAITLLRAAQMAIKGGIGSLENRMLILLDIEKLMTGADMGLVAQLVQ